MDCRLGYTLVGLCDMLGETYIQCVGYFDVATVEGYARTLVDLWSVADHSPQTANQMQNPLK